MNAITRFFIILIIFGTSIQKVPAQDFDRVKVTEGSLSLPTYLIKAADKNPMFYENKSYQGASKIIYPYPMMDNLSNVKEVQTYTALYLENKYIKLCVLPEIGGRLFYATDKTNDYEIIYRQSVIKPANIGMLGAWISGGIEWCVFHHHRASTYMPVDYTISENDDGSASIWIGEIEPRHRMKWTIGITLHPDKSYLEVQVKMMNRTALPNSILYWANVAVHVNDDYRTIFPPSVDYTVFHAKNSFSHWPVTYETYNGREYYQNKIDASWWKNHPDPTSFFAFNLKENFFAGYDYGKDAGIIHVGNHHILAGAKLWEWGTGDYGKMWDSQVLTDSDGPYAELMIGGYSDNQPDYSWLKQYETKHLTQYWYPLRNTGAVKSANKDAAINLERVSDSELLLAFNTTRAFHDAIVILFDGDKKIFENKIFIDPANPFKQIIRINENTDTAMLKGLLVDNDRREIISYQAQEKQFNPELPPSMTPPKSPAEIETIEELYLTGLRIKQFHNARLFSMDYFDEALKRDPLDSRCNTQVGLEYLNRGMYNKAASHFRNAARRISENYTRPRNCESFYYLGLTLKHQANYDAAYDTLYMATWDYAFTAAAYHQLAEIATIKLDYIEALEHVDRSLNANSLNFKAQCLKSALLRKLDRVDEAEKVAQSVLKFDPLNHLALNELSIIKLKSGNSIRDKLIQMLRNNPESYIELAADYLNFGLYKEAEQVLQSAVSSQDHALSNHAIIHYYLGFIYSKLQERKQAEIYFRQASAKSTDYIFPFRLESIPVLNEALSYNERDSRACYYLGNILYDKQPENAIEFWNKAVQYENSLAIAHRNLGWGYAKAIGDIEKAIQNYEAAISFNNQDARYFYELDLLYEKMGTPVSKRLSLLQSNHEIVKELNIAYLREIMVLTMAGNYNTAIEYLDGNYFQRQEGLTDLHGYHVDAHLLRGLEYLSSGDMTKALNDFFAADQFPENHQIGKDPDYVRYPQINYLIGMIYRESGEKEKAESNFKAAINQKIGHSVYSFYQGMSFSELGNDKKSGEIFNQLIEVGKEKLDQLSDVDFFAKFGSEKTNEQRQASAHYMIALGLMGKEKMSRAKKELENVLQLDKYHIWARYYLTVL